MRKEALYDIIIALQRHETPVFDPEDFPCFDAAAIAGKDTISQKHIDTLIQSLSEADIPTFERAIRAIDEQELGWLGFKLVYDPAAAMSNTDNEVTKKYGEVGSASGEPFVFFCSDAKEVVASKPYSPRDLFQMKDVTRGPSMHNDQFDGLTWMSAPLFNKIHVWLLGASDVAAETAALAHHVGFRVTVADYDPAYINAERFPFAERIELPGSNFDGLNEYAPGPNDFVCVLTRGHMFDPESCVWASLHEVAYVGMMGCKGKNNTVHDLVISRGVSEEQWDKIKRPIGLKFGAKTPAELAISIVGELVDERYKRAYPEEARARHEASLGR
ncbi:MAG: XdhC family protein [Coriobacteriales bacterium]|nr:XdhC family protein [Coriobacteriales bacterium]